MYSRLVAAWRDNANRLTARDRAVDAAIALLVFGAAVGLLFSNGLGPPPADTRDGDALGVSLLVLACLPLVFRRVAPSLVLVLTTAPVVPFILLHYPGEISNLPVIAVYTLAAAGDRDPAFGSAAKVLAAIAFIALATAVVIVDDGGFPAPELAAIGVLWLAFWIAGDRARLRRERIAELEESDAARTARSRAGTPTRGGRGADEDRARIARLRRPRDERDSRRGRCGPAAAGSRPRPVAGRPGDDRTGCARDDRRDRPPGARPPRVRADGGSAWCAAALAGGHRIARGPPALRRPPGDDPVRGRTPAPPIRCRARRVPDRPGGAHERGQARRRRRRRARQVQAPRARGQRDQPATASRPPGPAEGWVPSNGSNGAEGGHGIVGMRERASLLGGTLEAQRVDGTFFVRALLPYDSEAL